MFKFLKNKGFYINILTFSVLLFGIYQYTEKYYYKNIYNKSTKITEKCKIDIEKTQLKNNSEIKERDTNLEKTKEKIDKFSTKQEKMYQKMINKKPEKHISRVNNKIEYHTTTLVQDRKKHN